MKHFPVYKLAIILIGALFLVAFQQDLVVAQNVTLSETITSTITFTSQSAQSSTPTAGFTTIFSAELTRIIQELLSALLIALLGSLLTYFLAIRRIRHQLEADIRKETEISRQRLKTDLDKEFLARYNERKWDTYTKFADIVRTMIESSKNQKLQKQFPKIVAELYGFTGDLWIVGGDNVVTAFNKWRSSLPDEEQTEQHKLDLMINLMQIIIEMRRDLGHESTEITPEDLLRTFINDFDEYIARNTAK